MRPAKPILILLAACWCFAAQAQVTTNVYRADSITPIHNLQANTLLLVDSSNKIPADLITSGNLDSRFQPLPDNKKITGGITYWMRVNITSATGFNNWWLLVLKGNEGYYAQHGIVDAWQVASKQSNKPGAVHIGRSGLHVPRSQKIVKE
ncbi:MAG: hypothetical protein WCF67_06910, partial [Chitinophagaceae bacterium]